MGAVLAQERDVAKIVQPLGVVDHDGIRGAVAEGQEGREDLFDGGHVGGDLVVTQHLAGLVLSRWVADLGCSAAH